MCSGSEAGSYLRLIDFVYYSTLGVKERRRRADREGQGVRRRGLLRGVPNLHTTPAQVQQKALPSYFNRSTLEPSPRRNSTAAPCQIPGPGFTLQGPRVQGG